ADREQHLVEMAAGVEMAIQRPLQRRPDRSAKDEGERKRRKERPALVVDEYRADIAAGHGEGTMRKVDEVHQPERYREATSEHEQQHAVGGAVEQDGEYGGHRSGLADLTRHSGQRASAEPGISLSNFGIPGSR